MAEKKSGHFEIVELGKINYSKKINIDVITCY